MPSSRRTLTPLAAIFVLILLSVVAVISLGEGFKKFGTTRDGVKIKRRDTITFNMPWNPPVPDSKQEVKAISPAAGAILDAVGKVAAALLDGGSDIANLAESAISGLSSTALAAASSQVPSRVQDVNSQVDQATGVVGGIVSAATDIVGSLLAGTGASGVTSMPVGERNTSTSMNVTAVLSRTTSGLNRSSTSSMPFNITSAPVLQQVPLTSTTTTCTSIPPCTACPAPKTETCTVTETWHSTHYESTATLFSFVAAFTYTCTETVSICPKSSLYPLAPPTMLALSATPSSLIACPNGRLAKRAEDCPPASSISNATTTSAGNSSSPVLYPDKTPSSHPCPNAGYSCSECPDGVFCPPAQTSAQDCICGYGWACGHCSQGWFCIPSPTPSPGSGVVSSAAALLNNVSTSQVAAPSVPSTMASFTANLPSLSSLPSALAAGGSGPGPFQPFPTSTGPLNQVTNSAGDLAGNIINNVNSALGNINGLSGAVLSSVMGQLSSVLGANFPIANADPTSLGAVTGAAGRVISNGAAGTNNPVGGLIPTASAIIAGVSSELLAAGIPVAIPGPLFQPTVTPPVINNVLPFFGKAVQEVTRTVIPQPVRSAGKPSDIISTPTPTIDEPNVISHLTTIIQGTSTVLPVVITVLNGKATVVPLVKMIVDGKEKDLPVVGADLSSGVGKIGSVKEVLDEDAAGVRGGRMRRVKGRI